MGNLRRKYHTFLNKNRQKGIPNLMLWICISNAIVFVLNYFFSLPIVDLLIFSSEKIMQGQIWRLFSFIFTFAAMSGSLFGSLIGAIFTILFYNWVGKLLEQVMGRLRFNLFYLYGILLMDLYLMLIYWIFDVPTVADAHYLNLSMFLATATFIPEDKVFIYFVIPVKMKWLAWLDLGICLYQTIKFYVDYGALLGYLPTMLCIGICLYALQPWVSILNYVLFFGKSVKHLFPGVRATYQTRKRQHEFRQAKQPEPTPDWAKNYRSASGARPYRHKCTVCGRTDTDCPDLEFRYCSRCNGYFCYCIDHINNHTHVE